MEKKPKQFSPILFERWRDRLFSAGYWKKSVFCPSEICCWTGGFPFKYWGKVHTLMVAQMPSEIIATRWGGRILQRKTWRAHNKRTNPRTPECRKARKNIRFGIMKKIPYPPNKVGNPRFCHLQAASIILDLTSLSLDIMTKRWCLEGNFLKVGAPNLPP